MNLIFKGLYTEKRGWLKWEFFQFEIRMNKNYAHRSHYLYYRMISKYQIKIEEKKIMLSKIES